MGKFNSFRLIRGEIGRSLAAYCGNSVYLDGALCWVTNRVTTCRVNLRKDNVRSSGYNYLKLMDHFMRLLFTSRTPPLRIVSFLGGFAILMSIAISTYAIWEKFTNHVPVQGWTRLVDRDLVFLRHSAFFIWRHG